MKFDFEKKAFANCNKSLLTFFYVFEIAIKNRIRPQTYEVFRGKDRPRLIFDLMYTAGGRYIRFSV